MFCGNPFFTTLGLANDVVNSSHISEHFFVIKTYTFNQGSEALQGQSIRPKKPDFCSISSVKSAQNGKIRPLL